MPNLRQRIIEDKFSGYNSAMKVYRQIVGVHGGPTNIPDKSKVGYTDRRGIKHNLLEIEEDVTGYAIAYKMANLSKTILFPAEQVEVFISLLGKRFDIPLEYKLPFQNTLIEFTSPVEITGIYGTRRSLGFLLEQQVSDEQARKKGLEAIRYADDVFGFDSRPTLNLDYSKNDTITINAALVFYEDLSGEQIAWTSQNPDGLETCEDWDESTESHMKQIKRLILACIGYINCENIYLQKEGEVSAAINAKRERKGKSRLEPYYVCRIRGVQYDSQGYEKGAGVKHGIRYDVRGHFRHLATGKTTWVRAHQRGLQNELYVPKTYLVDKMVN